MSSYRLYLRRNGRFQARLDFQALNASAAQWIANQVRDACSDCCDTHELWHGVFEVTPAAELRPDAESLRSRVEERAIETEEALLRSNWAVARSRRLLDRLKEVRRHGFQEAG